MGYPSIYPTGVTIYNKEKAYSGYTIFPSAKGALLIDMNGNEVKLWAGLGGFPNKILPGGYVMGTTGARGGKYAYQDQLDLVQVDWDGHIVWKFDKTELVADPGKEPVYMARQHHDFQREGSTVGYYYPNGEPKTDSSIRPITVQKSQALHLGFHCWRNFHVQKLLHGVFHVLSPLLSSR